MPSPAHPRPPPQAPASWAHGDAAFMRVRGLEGGRQPERWGPESLWPASWHAKRESDMGLPAKKKALQSPKGAEAKQTRKQGTGRAARGCTDPARAAALLFREPAPGLHNRFHGTWFCCHNNLRMARRWAAQRLEVRNGFSSRPRSQHIFEGLPHLVLRLCLCQVRRGAV